ncbi:MAG TPA: hypothetical protein VF810_02995 [Patescibacteria group bacterium]
MPSSTTTEPSVEELEQSYNAPTTEHPLGARETNISGDSTPKDSELTASTPKDTSDGGDHIRNGASKGKQAVKNVANKGKQAVKKGVDKGKQAVGKAAQAGAEAAAAAITSETGGWGKYAVKAAFAAGKIANTFLRRPEQTITRVQEMAKSAWSFGKKVLTVVLVIVLIVIFLLAPMNDVLNQAAQSTQTTGSGSSPLQVTKSGPTTVAKGGNITYNINVSYAGSATNVIVNDPLPQGATYISSCYGTPCIKGGTVTKGAVTWDAQKLGIPLNNPINLTFSLTIKAPNNDTHIINQSLAQVIGGSAGGGSGGIPNTPGNVTANSDSCHGVYSHWMSMVQQVLSRLKIPGANYGDPQCSLVSLKARGTIASINPGLILTALQTIGHLSPNEAKAVWTCVIPNESGYDPNAYNPQSTSAQSSGTPGAFGFFQMNALGFNWASYDVGDVDWTLQIANGVKMRDHEGGWHGYWPSAYQSCLNKFGVN